MEGRDEEVETRKLLLLRQTAAHSPPMIRITLLAEDSRETVLKVEGDLVEDRPPQSNRS